MTDVKTISDLPISVYMSNDGRIHVDVDSDIVFHFRGRKTEVIDDEALTYSRSSIAIATEGTLQLNPEADFLKEILGVMLKNHTVLDQLNLPSLEDKIDEVPLVKKTKLIRKQYIRNLRYKKGCKCGRSSG
jgi:hypothetical protein